jgi:hypothetical protein
VAPGYRGHPRRSDLGCAERGNPVEVRATPGKPTARKAQLLLAAGQDGPTSKCRQAERPQEAGAGGCFLLRPPRRNWPDTGSCPARKGADADQVSPWSFAAEGTETEGQVGRDGGIHGLMASSTVKVNGPEDDLDGWGAIDWRAHEDNVRRLRQRIFKATKEGDPRRVRRLQKLMLRSRSNTLTSVRQVTQRNAGRTGSTPAINESSTAHVVHEACLSRVR